MKRLVLFASLLALPALADVTTPRGKVDCYCTDGTGARVEMGQRTCLSVGGRAYIANCEMSLNVPMWRDTGETCLAS